MEIRLASTEDKKALYRLTHAISAGKVIDLNGQVVQPRTWAIYEDADKATGETKEVLSMELDSGEVVGTISATFIREFEDIVETFGNEQAIEIRTGKTKQGREFVFPVLA